jgi:hypothetical protein
MQIAANSGSVSPKASPPRAGMDRPMQSPTGHPMKMDSGMDQPMN